MKTSELIKMLQNNLDKYGDLNIKVSDYDDYQFLDTHNIMAVCMMENSTGKYNIIQLLD